MGEGSRSRLPSLSAGARLRRMPTFERDGVSLHYEIYGEGFPVLVFAPGGMRSGMRLRWMREAS